MKRFGVDVDDFFSALSSEIRPCAHRPRTRVQIRRHVSLASSRAIDVVDISDDSKCTDKRRDILFREVIRLAEKALLFFEGVSIEDFALHCQSPNLRWLRNEREAGHDTAFDVTTERFMTDEEEEDVAVPSRDDRNESVSA